MSDYCVYGENRTGGCKTAGERESKGWHKTQRERETLVKLARYNRKRSNLLLITAKPLLHHPSRQRGGRRHSRLLPSDNGSEHTKSLIIYLSEAIHGTATIRTTARAHTHLKLCRLELLLFTYS